MPDPIASGSPLPPPPGAGGGMPPGGPDAAPKLPGSPIGGPGGPGGSPMMSPGAGAGNQAAAVQQVKAVMPSLLTAAMAFPAGSKEQQALLRAVSALNPLFGKAEGQNMVPSALATMAMAAKGQGSGPLSAAPPPGLSPDSSKPPAGIELPQGMQP